VVVVGLVVVLVEEVVVVLDVVVVSLPTSDEHVVTTRVRTTVMARSRRMTDLHSEEPYGRRL
jgi:hypothetical protein